MTNTISPGILRLIFVNLSFSVNVSKNRAESSLYKTVLWMYTAFIEVFLNPAKLLNLRCFHWHYKEQHWGCWKIHLWAVTARRTLSDTQTQIFTASECTVFLTRRATCWVYKQAFAIYNHERVREYQVNSIKTEVKRNKAQKIYSMLQSQCILVSMFFNSPAHWLLLQALLCVSTGVHSCPLTAGESATR